MPSISHLVFECASGIRMMIVLYQMAQHDSSCNTLQSRSSLNSSWGLMMFQPKLLNNVVIQGSQQDTPYTVKHILAKPTPFVCFCSWHLKAFLLSWLWIHLAWNFRQNTTSTILFICHFYHLWQMVICLKFLKNILAAELQIKTIQVRGNSKFSYFYQSWLDFIFFLSAHPVHASLHACKHPYFYILLVFWCLEIVFSYIFA